MQPSSMPRTSPTRLFPSQSVFSGIEGIVCLFVSPISEAYKGVVGGESKPLTAVFQDGEDAVYAPVKFIVEAVELSVFKQEESSAVGYAPHSVARIFLAVNGVVDRVVAVLRIEIGVVDVSGMAEVAFHPDDACVFCCHPDGAVVVFADAAHVEVLADSKALAGRKSVVQVVAFADEHDASP